MIPVWLDGHRHLAVSGRLVNKEVSGGRVWGKQKLGWMEGVTLALCSSEMTVGDAQL